MLHRNKVQEFSFLSSDCTVLRVDMAIVDTKDMALLVRAIKAYGMVELSSRRLPNLDTRLRLVLTFTAQQLSILFDLYKKLRHELLESCFIQVIRDSARLSACNINRALSTQFKMEKYILVVVYKRERILCLRSRKALEDVIKN